MKEIKDLFESILGREGQRNVDLKRMAAQEGKSFPYAILAAATNNFADNCKLGQGGSGSVYKGKLKDGRVVAVKVLPETSRGTKEFENEAKLVSNLEHRNVVKLLGYCAQGKNKLLMYEYVPNNNLGKLLSDSNGRQQLDWPRRHAIIEGIACGLLYIHQHTHKNIIHRDIKFDNILIDENWKPKIADFGLGCTLQTNQSHVSTKPSGTWGYIAPEVLETGHVTVKADVYSFGVVLLEIVNGKKISTFQAQDDKNLLDWAYELYQEGRSSEFMDRTLEASAVTEQVEKCIEIGLLCAQGDPNLRPNMKDVMSMLTENKGHIKKPVGRPGFYGYTNHAPLQSQQLQDTNNLASGEVTEESEVPNHMSVDEHQSQGILLNSSQSMLGDPSTSSFTFQVQADRGHRVYAPKSKIMKTIWNTINRILNREGHEEFKKIDAKRLKQFSYKTLLDATVGFAGNRKLGEGGFGRVYKGELKDGREVAVKVLKSSRQGLEEFMSGVMLMSSLQHHNVVKLLGYCAHKDEKLLVYEFVSNNSLAKLLFGNDSNEKLQLDWPRRYGIVRGIAWGLRYLHQQYSHESIIHGDIRPDNILIDEQWEPKITESGLSCTSQPNETSGYIAPELFSFTNTATQNGDIYGLGVTVLEIISGKRISFNLDEDYFKYRFDEAYELYKKGRSLEFMDRTLEASAVTEQVEKSIAIGLLCTQGDPESRPDMKDVVFMLENQGPVERTIGRPGHRGYFTPTWLQDANNLDSSVTIG